MQCTHTATEQAWTCTARAAPSTALGRSLVHKLEHKGAGGGVQLAHVLHELQVRHARHQLQLAIKKQVSKWEAATCSMISR